MTAPLTVFYDGLCPLCSREMEHYRRRATDGAVRFVDITAADFTADAHGVDPVRVNKVMHVSVGGRVLTGVDAFVALWQVVPGYRWLARIARLPGARFLMGLGYRFFAAVRPYLPRRRRTDCPCGACRQD